MAWQHAAVLAETPPDGLRFVRCGVWIKPDGAPQFTGDRPGTGWEAVAILHAAGGKMRWNGGGHHAVWTHGVERDVPGHPTPKPLALIRRWVRDFTDTGDLVIDPFAGSGTTLRACKDLGRRCIGVEQNADYCEIAKRRLAQEVLL